MSKIVAYKKIITPQTTKQINDEQVVELLTVDDTTYLSVPDDFDLTKVDKELDAKFVDIDEDMQKLLSQSSHVQLINKRVKYKIAERYSITDEIELLRNAPSAEFDEYHAYAEQCRQWGYEQKLKLGVINVTK